VDSSPENETNYVIDTTSRFLNENKTVNYRNQKPKQINKPKNNNTLKNIVKQFHKCNLFLLSPSLHASSSILLIDNRTVTGCWASYLVVRVIMMVMVMVVVVM
jgi:hypothetical protein